MSRVVFCISIAALMLPAMPEVRADIVVGTIDPIRVVAPSILRIDEHTGTNLTAAEIPVGTGGLSYATDIAVGPDGNTYVSDSDLAKVLWFDGDTSSPVPSPIVGESDGVFAVRSAPFVPDGISQSATSLTFGRPGDAFAGDVFVVQQDLGLIEVYDGSDGTLKGTLLDDLDNETPSPVTLASVTFTPSGELLASDLQGSRIFKVDLTGGLAGEVVTEFVSGPGGAIFIDGNPELFFPAGMATDSVGNVYVANIFGNDILRFDSAGENPEIVLTIPGELTEPNYFNPNLPPSHFPSDVIVENDNSLLLAILGQKNTLDSMGMPQDTEGRVLRVDLSTSTPDVQTLIDNQLPVTSVALIDDLLPGDYDGDGTVAASDYNEWKAQFGTAVTPNSGADGNGDGFINVADYTVWRDSLGATAILPAAQSLATNVPEPSTLILLAMMSGWIAHSVRGPRES